MRVVVTIEMVGAFDPRLGRDLASALRYAAKVVTWRSQDLRGQGPQGLTPGDTFELRDSRTCAPCGVLRVEADQERCSCPPECRVCNGEFAPGQQWGTGKAWVSKADCLCTR